MLVLAVGAANEVSDATHPQYPKVISRDPDPESFIPERLPSFFGSTARADPAPFSFGDIMHEYTIRQRLGLAAQCHLEELTLSGPTRFHKRDSTHIINQRPVKAGRFGCVPGRSGNFRIHASQEQDPGWLAIQGWVTQFGG